MPAQNLSDTQNFFDGSLLCFLYSRKFQPISRKSASETPQDRLL